MEIYWIDNKRQCGPASVPDVLSMIEAGDVTWETQGWHRGCADWMPLSELPALSYYARRMVRPSHEVDPERGEAEENWRGDSRDSSPAEELGKSPDPGEMASEALPHLIVPMPSPTLRLLARVVDCFLYLTLAFGVLRAVGAGFHLAYGTPLIWLPMCLLEGWIIYRFGTTPGKKLLGFGVTTFDNQRLPFMRSLLRACSVFVFGMGMMYFPVLPPVMMGIAWYQVRKRGLTSWDVRLATLPRMQVAEVRPERILLSLVVIFVCLQVSGMLAMAWAPEIQSSLHEAMHNSPPEMHRFIDSMFP